MHIEKKGNDVKQLQIHIASAKKALPKCKLWYKANMYTEIPEYLIFVNLPRHF